MRGALLASLLALGACAAPSSFDGVAGGTKEDAAVEAPRPVSPVTVSLVASSRPRLKWSLGASATGAIVEMSRTRDFVAVKRFEARGTELVVPEDLELGVWFWRLKGAAAGTVGTTASVIWEMVVRGPAANGSSDAPTRSMVDMNGDGEPDLLIGATVADGDGSSGGGVALPGGPSATGAPKPAATTSAIVFFYGGDPVKGFSKGGKDGILGNQGSTYDGPMAIGGGTDFDGDGFTDMIEAGSYAMAEDGQYWFDPSVTYASKGGEWAFDIERGGPLYIGQGGASTLPSVREGADVDGDGYGDALIGLEDFGFLMLGSVVKAPNMPAIMAVAPGMSSARTSKSRVAMGSFDANGDGLADVAFSYQSDFDPTARAFAAAGDRAQRIGEPKMIDAPDARLATAFAAGDFNGDGIDDVAVTTPVGSATRICLWYGHREQLLTPGPCVAAPAGDADFGASLTAVDLEGDGVDELLATAKTGDVEGVRVVRVANGAATAQPIGQPGLGVRLTTIWPGRPGKARWAAVAADGSRVGVYEGAELKETLTPPPGTVRGFGRVLR
ncbi:hypothetical protein BH11MYX4_BH11MYX4_41550 [soil metagenome]